MLGHMSMISYFHFLSFFLLALAQYKVLHTGLRLEIGHPHRSLVLPSEKEFRLIDGGYRA